MIIENTIPFGGFYESIHQFDDECEIEYINEQREEKGLGPIDFDDLEVDYKAYELDYSKQYVEKFLEELKNDTEICEMIGLKSIKFESLYSPRQYNFSTDEITVKYNLDNKIFKDFIEKLKDNKEFEKHIREKYKSCDGFCSFIKYEKFFNDIENSNHLEFEIILRYLIEKFTDSEFMINVFYEMEKNSSEYITNFDKLISQK